jgi:hypothetical protein
VAVPVGGDAELPAGDGAGDDVAGCGLLAGDGLVVADGLLVADGLPVGDGDVAGELTGAVGTAGAGAGIGSVAWAPEPGNSALMGSAGTRVCLAAAGEGAAAGADDGEAAWSCGPSRPCGLTAALFAATGKPAESVGPTR